MNTFNSKILLFGEYTILNGSMALAIPFPKYSGHLVLPATGELPDEKAKTSNQAIKRWAKYLTEQNGFIHPPSGKNLLSDALTGLYFDSNIPQGYGIGSSGALTAAVYCRYFCDPTDYKHNPTISLLELKADLSLMESYFHGSSSGIDPLVSYLDEPLLIKDGSVFKLPMPIPNNLKIFLIDTGSPAKTGNLVQLFHNKWESAALKPAITKMGSLTNSIIEAFSNNTLTFAQVEELSSLQQAVLSEMFVLTPAIEEAMQQFKGSCCVKLCGSGGGGYLLGFAKSDGYQGIVQYLTHRGIAIIPIETDQACFGRQLSFHPILKYN